MTLNELMTQTGLECRLSNRGECIIFHGVEQAPKELWDITDYKVSSVSGGSVWLIPVKN